MLSEPDPIRSSALAASAHFVLRQRNVYRARVQRVAQRLAVLERSGAGRGLDIHDLSPAWQAYVQALSDALLDIEAITEEPAPIKTPGTEEADDD